MEDEKFFFRRSNVLLGIFIACLICFTVILYNAQIVHGSDYLSQSTTQVTHPETVETSRGIVTDRNGKVLVSNRQIYSVTFDPNQVPSSDDPDVSHDRSVALALLRLLRLCQEQDIAWTDGLPVSAQPPYAYTISAAGDTQRDRFRRFLADLKWSDTDLAEAGVPLLSRSLREEKRLSAGELTCGTLLDLMREEFDLPDTFTAGEVRLVSGVLYELRLRQLSEGAVTIPYVLIEDVTPEFISLLNDGGFTGAVVSSESVRLYNTDYAAHILGRVGAIQDKEELAALNEPYNAAKDAGQDTSGIRRYDLDDKVGRDGVEKAFETYLAGLDGTRLITTDQSGKKTDEIYSVEPQPGATVALTIDIDFQAKVEAALAATVERMNAEDAAKNPNDPKNGTRGAAAAVVSVADSDILALATCPTYSQRTYAEDREALEADPAGPFVNRAVNGAYAPGSTFKPMMAVAALEAGALSSPTEKVYSPGTWTYPDMVAGSEPFTMRCWGGTNHGRINVSQAITESCNVFFYEMGYRLGIDTMNQYARAFGLGEHTGIEIDEKTGTLAGPEEREAAGGTWYGGDTIQAAIGQSDNLFTPLQMANYIATLLRGGDRLAAHLLNTVTSYDGDETILDFQPEVLSSIDISDSTLAAVKKGMGDLVTRGSVSGYFRNCIVTAGAKTGSIQMGNDQTNGAFVCFAPFDDPEIAVAVVIERGGSGAAVASTAVEILNAYFAESDIGTAFIPEGQLLP